MKMCNLFPLLIIVACGNNQEVKQTRYRYPPIERDHYAVKPTPTAAPTKPPVDQSPAQHPPGTYFRCKCYIEGWSEGKCDYTGSEITHTVRFIFADDWPAYFLPADKCKVIW